MTKKMKMKVVLVLLLYLSMFERRGHLEPVLMLLELVPPQCHCCAK